MVDNESARYIDRWVDLRFEGSSPWVKDIKQINVPIAHGEGKFYASDAVLKAINDGGLVSARYVSGQISENYHLEVNPNGSLENIASITDPSGRLIGMMPHPERAVDFTQMLDWTKVKEVYRRAGKEIPCEGPGLKIFENGVKYFKD